MGYFQFMLCILVFGLEKMIKRIKSQIKIYMSYGSFLSCFGVLCIRVVYRKEMLGSIYSFVNIYTKDGSFLIVLCPVYQMLKTGIRIRYK